MAPPRQASNNQSKANRHSSQQSPNPSSTHARDRPDRIHPQPPSQSTTPSTSNSTVIMTPTSSIASLPPQTPTSATIASLPNVSSAPLSAAPPPNENVWQQMAANRAAATKKDGQVRVPSQNSGTSAAGPRIPDQGKTPSPIIPQAPNTTEDRHVPVNGFNASEVRNLLMKGFAPEAKTYQLQAGNEPEGRSTKDREKDVIRMLSRGLAGLSKETVVKGG